MEQKPLPLLLGAESHGVQNMSMPSFPPNGADMTRAEALTMIIASIAMEELALSHILNAEGEKLQYILGTLHGTSHCACPQDVLAVNKSVTALVEAVRGGAAGMLSVCAFVIFFYVLAAPLAAMGGRLGPLLVGLTELFSLTPLLAADGFGFVLAAGCAGWGGLSVLCQTAAVLEGSSLRMRNCLLGKVLQGLLSAVLALALQKYVLG